MTDSTQHTQTECFHEHPEREYVCTLPSGHDGDHEAWGMDPAKGMYASWPQADDEERTSGHESCCSVPGCGAPDEDRERASEAHTHRQDNDGCRITRDASGTVPRPATGWQGGSQVHVQTVEQDVRRDIAARMQSDIVNGLQDDLDPNAIPLCESCGSSACCGDDHYRKGYTDATKQIVEVVEGSKDGPPGFDDVWLSGWRAAMTSLLAAIEGEGA